MTVLEAFRAGTPVVVTDSLGISEDCRSYGAAVVTDGSVAALADAVIALLDDPVHAEKLRAGATSYLRDRLDISSVADTLSETYEAVTVE